MIAFPKLHIAESSVNRILNVAEGLSGRALIAPAEIPPLGLPHQPLNVQTGGESEQTLNAGLSSPVPAVQPPTEDQASGAAIDALMSRQDLIETF